MEAQEQKEVSDSEPKLRHHAPTACELFEAPVNETVVYVYKEQPLRFADFLDFAIKLSVVAFVGYDLFSFGRFL